MPHSTRRYGSGAPPAPPPVAPGAPPPATPPGPVNNRSLNPTVWSGKKWTKLVGSILLALFLLWSLWPSSCGRSGTYTAEDVEKAKKEASLDPVAKKEAERMVGLAVKQYETWTTVEVEPGKSFSFTMAPETAADWKREKTEIKVDETKSPNGDKVVTFTNISEKNAEFQYRYYPCMVATKPC